MYLYLFEAGEIWQMPLPPTEIDREHVRQGVLQVFNVESGRYLELGQDLKWKTVPPGQRYEDQHCDCPEKQYSFVAEDKPVPITDSL